MMVHDFNGKKGKIIQTLKQIDELRSGVVKLNIFQNILSCLDVQLDQADLDECQKKFGMSYQGLTYIKYEAVLRIMHYDNHSEKWIIKGANDDGDMLSVVTENARGGRGLKNQGMRQSFEGHRKKPLLQRESLRNAIRTSTTVLSENALANFEGKSKKREDEKAVEVLT